MKLRNILGKNNLPDGLKGQGNKNELKEFLSESNTETPILKSEISTKKS